MAKEKIVTRVQEFWLLFSFIARTVLQTKVLHMIRYTLNLDYKSV